MWREKDSFLDAHCGGGGVRAKGSGLGGRVKEKSKKERYGFINVIFATFHEFFSR